MAVRHKGPEDDWVEPHGLAPALGRRQCPAVHPGDDTLRCSMERGHATEHVVATAATTTVTWADGCRPRCDHIPPLAAGVWACVLPTGHSGVCRGPTGQSGGIDFSVFGVQPAGCTSVAFCDGEAVPCRNPRTHTDAHQDHQLRQWYGARAMLPDTKPTDPELQVGDRVMLRRNGWDAVRIGLLDLGIRPEDRTWDPGMPPPLALRSGTVARCSAQPIGNGTGAALLVTSDAGPAYWVRPSMLMLVPAAAAGQRFDTDQDDDAYRARLWGPK